MITDYAIAQRQLADSFNKRIVPKDNKGAVDIAKVI